uniref:Transposase n=1 Tax=Strongyloides venezuelensis TaxID=75913 RepID=A0A0K0FP86_STRVS
MKLKSHIITYLPVIARKFGNMTKYSCFAGEGLIQTLGRMISQRTENNSLNQIKKRFKDLHMACYVIRKKKRQNRFQKLFHSCFNEWFYRQRQFFNNTGRKRW